MNLITTLDHGRQRLSVKAEGYVTLADIIAHLEDERRAGILSYRELIDGRGARPDFAAEEVRKLVAVVRELAGSHRLGRTAVIVDNEVAYGMLRMLEMLVDDAAAIRPFRSEQEAEAWLDTERR
jgi:hypothetical protein